MWLFEDRDRLDDQVFDGLPHLSLVYEDDLLDAASQQRTVDRICALIGLRPETTNSDLVKFHPVEQKKLVNNYDELVATLGPTRYARYLDP